MNKLKKTLSIVLALVILAAGIYTVATQSAAPSDGTGGSAVEQPNAPQPAQPDTPAPDDDIVEGAYYYDVESVVLYLDAFGRLPDNYITKSEAEKLGWSGGSVEHFRAGAAIGGGRYGNYEGLLPEKSGRHYTECDIDTLGRSSRGAKRLVFSNDGLYFYTDDHYESFTELVVRNGAVEWK